MNFEDEEELILRETGKLHLNLAVEDSGSADGLKDMVIGAGGFDVLHISGHAGIDDKKGPVFYMENEIGRQDKVTPERFNKALQGFQPSILFLSGCSTSKRDWATNDPSFTEKMVSFGVPFVMGWAEPVYDTAASKMAAHESAAKWYDTAIDETEQASYSSLSESVYHSLAASRIRQACKYAILLGQIMKNMQLYRERLEMQQNVAESITEAVIAEALAEKDENVAGLMNHLGQAYHMMGNYPRVIQWVQKALAIDVKILGDNPSKVAIRYNNLGVAYQEFGKYSKAIEYYEKSLSISKLFFDDGHPSVELTKSNLEAAKRTLSEP